MTLTNSRESEITIEKEIDVLRKYLELEQMRFKHRFDFDFELTISNKEMQKSIPPMLIQPFVENSVIHGFKSLKAGGLIKISFLKMENGILFAEVRDNGIGYQNTLEKDNTEHKSYGTRITTERLNLFKQKYQGEFMYSIESLVDPEGNVTGTIVRMTIPVI
jgi:LytS/YehU family sensor histidine kinase